MKERFKLERIVGIFKWLYPGIGIKRWILVAAFGLSLLLIGAFTFDKDSMLLLKLLDIALIVLGIFLLISGIVKALKSFIFFFFPELGKRRGYADIIYRRRQLERGPNIVTIGGGTGLPILLEGLREYTSNISAIVTVADDGGSSGRLRQQFDILPPGDTRNCLVALADAPVLMRDLFQFRFDSSSEFSGHNFGNLFITVMTQVTGDFDKAIKESSKVLAIRGQVIPSTLNKVLLAAEYQDGSITEGEANIPKVKKPIKRVWLKPEGSQATEEAIWAIQKAQIIVFGPGSLYTSIIPNLLVKEICDAIVASDAIKIYVCNIMTQVGETDGFTASDHLKALIQHTHPKIVDYCLLNSGSVSEELKQRYKQEGAYLIVPDIRKIRNMGYRPIEDNLITSVDNYIRHDSIKLTRIILGLIEEI
ncbi:MAG: YvcK family protein [Candidatus Omnitrophica bacterium]|nr:YvcK family protein [Candidatus Omnitrophota bacterium]MBU1871619.1 YvcK family protein [Candidatus Omnitrophota bacterium]